MPKEKSPIIDVVKKVGPAVVSIVISKRLRKVDILMPFGILVPRKEMEKVKIGGGSGFIIDSSGLILTNRHVVADKQAEYMVVTLDEKKYKAKVLGRDPINDIAVLKIDAKNLPTVKLGDSSKIDLGQTVVAIGNALGTFQNTVSTGIISGLSRFIHALDFSGHAEQLRGLIQTDAAINPGNSGGPLVNIFGEVIGISSAMVMGAENIGFAIPVNAAKQDLADLKKYGKIVKPSLGLRDVVLNKVLKEKYTLPVDYGALVLPEQFPGERAVIPGGPADKAGIKALDIILEFNDKKITQKQGIMDYIQECKVGEVVTLKILRDKKKITAKVKLCERK
jgi:serine protease Do